MCIYISGVFKKLVENSYYKNMVYKIFYTEIAITPIFPQTFRYPHLHTFKGKKTTKGFTK